MNRSVSAVVLAALAALSCVQTATAGPYSDDLAKCLVKSTSTSDKSILVQWMFASISLHPEVKWMTSISDAERAPINQKTAALFERLLTETCLSETKEAMKYEGVGTIESAFGVLGNVAAREMFESPEVTKGSAALDELIDSKRIEAALSNSK